MVPGPGNSQATAALISAPLNMPWAIRSLNMVAGGVLGVQVHRVVVAGHRGEQLDVALFDGLAVAGGLADFEGFVRGVGNLGHLSQFL
jgi:hypothetical protein